ncbi:uncharacterized protein EI90DRAFT_92797 [Cantharellus anzutake]|uniref:uncharacterized protein n=1 Tax=Cantharellus anzutake TaxID=1750568 RepID=UPI001908287A|nr:uncharacterized protein EI90DRAFT_92797 [Cantharellus anzutake]KAF8336967.1 hypothetical protein EI90DRAFT_92797 [Cantharellus anzutake]
MMYLLVTEAQAPVVQGANFFGWAVEKCPSIDLNALVYYLEHLSLRVISECRRAREDPYHSLLLPRSWAIFMTGMNTQAPRCNFNIYLFLGHVVSLLRTVNNWNGYGSLTFQGRPFPLSWTLRGEILARICRALVLIGFNCPASANEWRVSILNSITMSFDPKRPHGNLYSR